MIQQNKSKHKKKPHEDSVTVNEQNPTAELIQQTKSKPKKRPGEDSRVQHIESQLSDFLTSVAKVDGIARVGEIETYGSDLRIQVIPGQSSRTMDAERLIKEIRALEMPAETLIGGVAADFTDSQNGIARTLPIALGWIAFWVMILIFIFTGSIILPIKAVLLNGFSLIATLGAITWIFIDGHLKWLVGDFTVTGALDTGSVILVASAIFWGRLSRRHYPAKL